MTVLDASDTAAKAEQPAEKPAPPAGPAKPRLSENKRLLQVLGVAAALAAIAALVFGLLFASAMGDDDIDLAVARDAALIDAQQAAVVINTYDSADPKAVVDRWLTVAGGSFAEELATRRAAAEKRVTDLKWTTTVEVKSAAVSELNLHAGTAQVIVGIDMKAKPLAGGEEGLLRYRMEMEMVRTDAGWKASRFALVGTPTAG
ncbi:hypothetical protein [Pseudonocardia sp. TRM90224]|uniref:hypothetical protein n=1 Tax=Pseudonocardia sp. TRM90224 TaxID=2812678 RepID=UPI001E4AC714|nr:hypothetical protein [Pseudonocardia sp. TRM90224]